MKAVYRPDGILLQNIKLKEVDAIKQFIAEMESKNETSQNILPRPVVRDGNGKLIKDHTPRDFYLEDVAEEIADIITVCISYLDANGYDEEKRSELFAKVNEKNEKRGYFEEKILAKFTKEEK